MELSRRVLLSGVVGSAFLPFEAFGGNVRVIEGAAFGSNWRVVTDHADPGIVRQAISTAFERINADMSPYLSASALSRFNAAQSTRRQGMPEDVCSVASKALEFAVLTDGAFDPTVGPIVSRYGFGPIRGETGTFSAIEVERTSIRKADPGLTLDLCGIAKGYALDVAARTLRDIGVTNALVEVGGEVVGLGAHPSGRDWSVAITNPFGSAFEAYRIISPRSMALATSGHAVNGVIGRISTSHIIDPSLGQPASSDLVSVSVLAPSGLDADALATAFCAAGLESGVALARRLDVSALFVFGGSDKMRDVMTGRFEDFVVI